VRCLSLVVLSSACNLATNAVLPQVDRGDRGPDAPTGERCGDGGLLLSEVVDHGDAKFVELFNAGPDPWPLAGHALQVYPNGQFTPNELLFGDEVIDPCSAWVIAFASGPFSAAFGVDPDQLDGVITGNGNDVYALVDHDRRETVDVYGEIGVDGVGEPWDYEDLSARRRPDVTEGTDQWEAGEWSYTPWDEATPGVR
jgi:hypothetical protein